MRGFGARSSFGVRGVRLYSDGIPGTMPDGQGQFSQFDLGSADHIEVLRGPFSALYGNSSGGVIAIFTEDAKPGYSHRRHGGVRHVQHSALRPEDRRATTARSTMWSTPRTFRPTAIAFTATPSATTSMRSCVSRPSDTSKLTMVANAVETPFVQDPLGTHARAARGESDARRASNALAVQHPQVARSGAARRRLRRQVQRRR